MTFSMFFFSDLCHLKRVRFALFVLIVYLSSEIQAKLSTDVLYNTTSGIYKARLVKVNDQNSKTTKYLHKLISIPYAEKPERFQQSILKSYEHGIHDKQESVACYQSINLTAYGLFNIEKASKMTEDCLVINLFIPVSEHSSEEMSLQSMPVVVHIHGGFSFFSSIF